MILETNKISNLKIHNLELEKSILYCLLYGKKLQRNIYKIDKDDFYNLDNKKIFLEFKKIIDNGEVILPETIPDILKRNKKYLEVITHTTQLTDFINILKKFKEISDMRKMQEIAYSISIKAQENKNPKEIRNWGINELKKINSNQEIEYKQQNEEIDTKFENILNDSDLVAVRTGYPRLDKITRGFLKSSFNIVASGQGLGKSTFILNIINHICYKQKKKVLLVSLEMDFDELHAKMISLISGVEFQKLVFESDKMISQEWQKVTNARAQTSEYDLYRIGEGETTPLDIEDTLRELKNVDIVFIDYLQLMSPNVSASTIREKITNLSRELKTLARKTKIPIVAISSINRDHSKRDDKKPKISDLRESGQLEYDAGLVLLLHRECKFRDANITKGENPEEFEKEAELIVAKNRFGEDNLIIKLYFDGAKSLIMERYDK